MVVSWICSFSLSMLIARNLILRICPCSRVTEAAECKVIVLPVIGDDVAVQLREQDLSWKDFLSSGSQNSR